MEREVSLKQIDANRRNAQRSTGPRTIEGKAIASRNSFKHGLAAKDFVLNTGPQEDPQAFEEFRDSLFRYYEPAQTLEEFLVERIAVCMWRLRRAYRAEREAVARQIDLCESDASGTLPCLIVKSPDAADKLPYGGAYIEYSKYADTVDQLEAVNKELLKKCVSQSTILPTRDDMRSILRYEITIERQLYKAFDQLERLQRARKGESVPPPINLRITND